MVMVLLWQDWAWKCRASSTSKRAYSSEEVHVLYCSSENTPYNLTCGEKKINILLHDCHDRLQFLKLVNGNTVIQGRSEIFSNVIITGLIFNPNCILHSWWWIHFSMLPKSLNSEPYDHNTLKPTFMVLQIPKHTTCIVKTMNTGELLPFLMCTCKLNSHDLHLKVLPLRHHSSLTTVP